MDNEIYILCNSPQCLHEISSGRWPDLHKKNLFTCNLAYTFFRTDGRHLNIFTDAEPIKAFLEQHDWPAVYDTWKYNKVEFIFSAWEIFSKKVKINPHKSCKANYQYSPLFVPGSSAINALLHLSQFEKSFNTIYLIGYTINEWQGIKNVKELADKKRALDYLNQKYTRNQLSDWVYRYDKN